MNTEKQKSYEIWESVDGSEKAMFTNDRSAEEYDFLTRDTDGRKMVLKKTFEADSIESARAIYNRFFGFDAG